jgi:hypothetical protein
MHPVEQIGRRLRIPRQMAHSLASLVLNRKRNDTDPLGPADEMVFIVASWVTAIVRVPPEAVLLLLKEMHEHLIVVAPECEAAWASENGEARVPEHELHFADSRYATWGVYDQFWDTAEGCSVNPLPGPPVWRTSAHLCGLYFSYQMQKERTDATSASHPPKSSG